MEPTQQKKLEQPLGSSADEADSHRMLRLSATAEPSVFTQVFDSIIT